VLRPCVESGAERVGRTLRNPLLRAQWAIFARHLAASKLPILIGPFRSEVGFELLYWIPFLNALRERYGISRDRCVAIGRGGSAVWYNAAGTADLYEHLPMDVVRTLSIQASQQTGSMKQNVTADWERHVCALTATGLGISSYHVLSPSWMYQLLAPWWEGRQPLRWLDRHVLHAAKMPAPSLPQGLQLPETFVAMRWYARPTWPLKEDLVLWTRKLVTAVASRVPVVLINAGFQADDHADIALGAIPNTFKLSDLAEQTPPNNLAIQSAVIARASAYVGTYGGMAQGAMRWGVPTVALYDQFGQTAPQHLALTQSLSLQTGVPFVAAKPGDLDALLPIILAKYGQKMAIVHHPEPDDSVMGVAV
jgi:hypothetical protein